MCSMCVKILFDYGTRREREVCRGTRGITVLTAEELAEIFIANIYFLQQDMRKRQQRAFTLMRQQFK